MQDRHMSEAFGLALAVFVFVAAVVAAGVVAEAIWSGRAGPALAHFRWGRFFLGLWAVATIVWALALMRLMGTGDLPRLLSAAALPTAFVLTLGVGLRWVFAELPRRGVLVTDPRCPELETMLGALPQVRELAFRLALARISAHCLRDPVWKARIRGLQSSLTEAEVAAAQTKSREVGQRLLADHAAAFTVAQPHGSAA
jgi:hypothetical protein